MEEAPPPTPMPSDTHSGVLGKGTSIMVVSTLILLLLNLVARVIIIRNVTQTQWGEFSLALALTGMLGIMGALGLPNAIARALAFERDAAGRWKLIRAAGTAALIASVLGSISVFLAAPLLAHAFADPNLTLVFQLFSISVGTTILSMVLAAFFQGMERAEPNAIFNQILYPALFAFWAAAAVYLHLGWLWVLLSYPLSGLFATLLLATYTARRLGPAIAHGPHDAQPLDRTGHVSLTELTITLFAVASLNLLTQYADTIILAWYVKDVEIVGYYTAAMTVARLFLVSNSSLMYLYLPVSSRLRSTGDMGAVRRSYLTTARWTVATTLPLFFVCWFDPGEVLRFAFGHGFGVAATALQVLAIGSLISVIIGPSPAALAGLGHPRANMYYGIASLSTNVALSFAFIPHYGLVGAAVAWSVARLVYPGLCLAHLWIGYDVQPFAATFLKPLALGLIVLVPVFYFLHPAISIYLAVPLLFFGATAIILLAYPATRSVERGDLAILGAFESAVRVRFPRLRRFLVGRIPPISTGLPDRS